MNSLLVLKIAVTVIVILVLITSLCQWIEDHIPNNKLSRFFYRIKYILGVIFVSVLLGVVVLLVFHLWSL